MTELSSLSEEERSLFRPFTRDSLKQIEERIAIENEKQKELERKRAEGEVWLSHSGTLLSVIIDLFTHSFININVCVCVTTPLTFFRAFANYLRLFRI